MFRPTIVLITCVYQDTYKKLWDEFVHVTDDLTAVNIF